MTPIADMVDQMVAAGASSTAIAVAVREMEAGRVADMVATRVATRSDMIPKRSKNAERCARYRKNRKQNQTLAKANDVATADSQTVSPGHVATRVAMSPPCNTSLPVLVLEGAIEKKKEGNARARGTRLSPDWQPSDADRQFALRHNVDPNHLRGEFVDFWIGVPGARGTKLDWSATWRNRVRQVQSFRKERSNGKDKSVLGALHRLEQSLAGEDDHAAGDVPLLRISQG
jgi:hypothetical protein